jgi:hypothetical protein
MVAERLRASSRLGSSSAGMNTAQLLWVPGHSACSECALDDLVRDLFRKFRAALP